MDKKIPKKYKSLFMVDIPNTNILKFSLERKTVKTLVICN